MRPREPLPPPKPIESPARCRQALASKHECQTSCTKFFSPSPATKIQHDIYHVYRGSSPVPVHPPPLPFSLYQQLQGLAWA